MKEDIRDICTLCFWFFFLTGLFVWSVVLPPLGFDEIYEIIDYLLK